MSREDKASFVRAIYILKQLHAADPNVPKYRYLLAMSLRESTPDRQPGEAMPDAGDESDSTETPESLLKALTDEYPGVPEYKHELAVTWSRINTFDLDSQSLEPVLMEDCLTQARKYAQELVDAYPTVPTYMSTLIHIHGKLSHVQSQIARSYSDRDKRDEVMIESERNLRAAIEHQESLIRRSGDALAWRLWLARFERRLSEMLQRQSRFTESREVLDGAIKRLEQYDETSETPAVALRVLAELFGRLEAACDAMGDDAGAFEARIAEQSYRDRLHESRRNDRPRPRPDF